MRKLYTFLAVLLFVGITTSAQVNSYTFSQTTGATYTEISGGILLGSTTSDDQRFLDPAVPLGTTADVGPGIPIGFNFVFNSRIFDRIGINNNGWLAFGTSADGAVAVNLNNSSNYIGISGTSTASPAYKQNRIAGFSRDIQAQATASLRVETIGSAPNRVCVIQFKSYKRFGSTGTGDDINYQIRLTETTNTVEIAYGANVIGATAGTPYPEVGLRGMANTDFNNRTSTTDWSATTAGLINTATVTFATGVVPQNGLIYKWTPPAGCTGAPTPGTITGPASICSGTSTNLTLGGASAGYGFNYQWKSSTTPGGPYTAAATGLGTTFNTGNLTATTYYVVDVQCANSATTVTTAEFTMTVNPAPATAVTPTATTICPGSTILLTASGANTYSWSPATGLNTTTGATVFATPAATTTYTVTGTAIGGCTGTANVVVTVNTGATLSLNSSAASICTGSSATLTASGVVSGNYTITAITYNPIATPGSGVTTLANAGTAVTALSSGSLDDGRWENIPLPFTFNFYGANFSSVTVSTNGWISLGPTNTTSTGYNVTLPNTGVPNNAIHAMTADLDQRTTGTVEYFTSGSAPNRMFVVKYTNTGFFSGGGNATFQAILYEGTNIIEVHTTSVTNTATNKAEAVENAAGTVAAIVTGRNNTATWSGLPDAYRFTPPALSFTWSPAVGLSGTTGSTVTATPTTSTTYTVSGTDLSTGCFYTARTTVLVNRPPAPSVVPLSATICNGQIQPLTATSINTAASTLASSGAISVTIPDNNAAGTTQALSISGVPAAAIITNIEVTFDLTHTFDGDMVFNLMGPNGNILNLVNQRGGSGDNFTSTTISSLGGLPAIASGTAPFAGSFAPDGVLGVGPTGTISNVTNFAGLFSTPNGNWTLAMRDMANLDFGILKSWSIRIYYYVPDNATWTPATGLFTDPSATIPYTGTNASTVYAKPATTTTYTVTASNTGCSNGIASSVITVNQLPAITGQPGNQNICPGQTATFTVAATGTGITYQWFKGTTALTNGGNISGATGSTLSISNVTVADNGNYTVVVSGTCAPTVTSAVAVLAVGAPPLITQQPLSQVACQGNTVLFSVASSSTGLTYQWFKGATPLVNGGNISGATSATLVISNITAADAGTYSVVITNSCSQSTTSTNAVLTFSTADRWLGTANSDWNNPGNWCNGVPTATTDVVIPAGTTFLPVVSATNDIRNLQIDAGATMTVGASGWLNIFGNNLTVNGTFNTSAGTIAFRNTANLNVPAITANNVVMNGTGGITLTGTLSITTALTLSSGNITLGNNSLTMTGGSIGSVGSHIITNGTGGVRNTNVGTATVVFPVGPDAASYNAVEISNGQGLNYIVSAATGVPATLANSAKAINRTWTIVSSGTPASDVGLRFSYTDAQAVGAGYSATAPMEAGYFNGTNWVITTPAGGTLASGSPTARQLFTYTRNFGTFVVSNFGGLLFPTATPNLDADIYSVKLMPNVVNNQSLLRVMSRRAMNVEWMVTDIQGRIVMKFNKPVLAGQNDFNLQLGRLATGSYQIVGYSDKGVTNVVKFVRL